MTVDDFLERMTVLFGAPDTIDQEAFFDEFRSMLKATHPRILEKAKDIIRDERTFKGWPTHGEVRDAVQRAAYAVKTFVPPEHRAFGRDEPLPAPDEETRARVAAMVREAVKKMAAGSETIAGTSADFAAGQRGAFESMQHDSPNSKLHRDPTGEQAA